MAKHHWEYGNNHDYKINSRNGNKTKKKTLIFCES